VNLLPVTESVAKLLVGGLDRSQRIEFYRLNGFSIAPVHSEPITLPAMADQKFIVGYHGGGDKAGFVTVQASEVNRQRKPRIEQFFELQSFLRKARRAGSEQFFLLKVYRSPQIRSPVAIAFDLNGGVTAILATSSCWAPGGSNSNRPFCFP